MNHRRGGDDRGASTLEWVAAVALLLLPIAVLAVATPVWASRAALAAAAAREAALVAVAHDDVHGARAAGRRAAVAVAAGRRAAAAIAAVEVHPPDADGDGLLDRRGHLTATVMVVVPGVALPGWGSVGAFSLSRSHIVEVDPFRSRE